MMDQRKLRKSDVYFGLAVCLFGIWIIAESSAMPMKDSWGGVSNVWYVSPALLPLLIGAALAGLGLILFGIGVKTVGLIVIGEDLKALVSRELPTFLLSDGTIRFFAVVSLFLIFVYLYIPRIDFFISATVFLLCMISLFFCCEADQFKRLLTVYVIGAIGLALAFPLGLARFMDDLNLFGGDLFAVLILFTFCIYGWKYFRPDRVQFFRYRLCLVIAVLVAFSIGSVFKYVLLVPLPKEGVVTMLLDRVLYFD